MKRVIAADPEDEEAGPGRAARRDARSDEAAAQGTRKRNGARVDGPRRPAVHNVVETLHSPVPVYGQCAVEHRLAESSATLSAHPECVGCSVGALHVQLKPAREWGDGDRVRWVDDVPLELVLLEERPERAPKKTLSIPRVCGRCREPFMAQSGAAKYCRPCRRRARRGYGTLDLRRIRGAA